MRASQLVEQHSCLGTEFCHRLLGTPAQLLDRRAVAERTGGLEVVLCLRRELRLVLDAGVDPAALLGDLREVADATVRDQRAAGLLGLGCGQLRIPGGRIGTRAAPDRPAQVREHPGQTRIVELAGNRRIDGHVLIGALERDVVALPLLAHVAQRILGAALVELVDDDDLGEVEHVDLLELARGAELARHHVDGHVDQVDDLRVALADAGGLDHHEVEAGGAQERDRVGQHRARRAVALRASPPSA